MLRSFTAAGKKLALRAGWLRGYGRLEGGLLAALFLGACSLLAPLDEVKVDSNAGGSTAVSGAAGQGLAPTAGVGAVAGLGGGGAGGMNAVAAGGQESGEGGEPGAAGAGSVEQANGAVCLEDGDCVSGFCIEGVCCDTSCEGACTSCREAGTGMAEGVCGFVRSGEDPEADCDESAEACGHDGSCDGAGACRFKGVDNVCGAESCSAGMYSPAAHCDGAGSCNEPQPISCGSYPCQGTLCAINCSPSLPCPGGLWCDSGSCKAKKTNGAMCGDGGECSSANCVDGVCCDGACGGTCRSCRAANTGMSEGHCAPITAGTDPGNECTAAAVSTCDNDGYCDGASGCRQYSNSTVCRAKSCADGVSTSNESAEVKCSAGACGNATTTGCGDYKCGGDTCRESCSQSSHCVKGKYCKSNECVTTKATGELCDQPAECTTGICGSYQTNVRRGHCCSTPNCTCPGPSFANLLQNPGFDRDLSHWDIREPITRGGSYGWYEFEERDMCTYSGQFERRPDANSSGYQVRFRQCVPVQQGTTYNFGGSWKSSRMPSYWPPYPDPNSQPVPDGEAWNASCFVAFYATMELCQDFDTEYQSRFSGEKSVQFHDRTSAIYQWFDFEDSITAPQSAQAAVMDCNGIDDYAPNVHIYYDKFYISPAPSKY
jgi:hypothetical protein